MNPLVSSSRAIRTAKVFLLPKEGTAHSHTSARKPHHRRCYTDSELAGRILDRAVNAVKDAGHACTGLVQRDEPRTGQRRCDMILIDLASGERVDISEDRGPGARGCHSRPAALLSAMEAQRAVLSEEASILILNKFGKIEGEGGGFRPLIADALVCGIPVLIAVPRGEISKLGANSQESSRARSMPHPVPRFRSCPPRSARSCSGINRKHFFRCRSENARRLRCHRHQ